MFLKIFFIQKKTQIGSYNFKVHSYEYAKQLYLEIIKLKGQSLIQKTESTIIHNHNNNNEKKNIHFYTKADELLRKKIQQNNECSISDYTHILL